MAVQLRFAQGATIGEYGQALVVAAGSAVTISARATGATTIASWRIRCWFSSDAVQFNPTVGSTGDVSPAAVASGTNASPTATFTPPTSGPYIFSVETWSDAAGTAGAASDVRELHVRWVNIADCEPAPVIGTTLKDLIDAQIAAGAGPHNNFSGVAFGWATRMHAVWSALDALITAHTSTSSTANTALSNAATAQSRADSAYSLAGTANSTAGTANSTANSVQTSFNAVAVPQTLNFSTTIAGTQTGLMEYSGADQSLVFTAGTPPYRPSSLVTVVIPAGTVTGAHTVTVDSTISQPATWPVISSAHDYTIRFFAESTTSIAATAVSEDRTEIDVTAPVISSVVVADSNPNRLVVTTNEAVSWTDATGFTLSGYTLGAVTGSGTTHYVALTPQVPSGASLGSLSWTSGTNVYNNALLQLATGSISVTNNVVAPTISTASIVGSTLTLNMSESCTCGGITGLSLSGTAETITALTGGSGTATLTFSLSGTVGSGTITLSASGSNQIADAGGTALASISGVSVSLAAAPTISSATINGTTLTVNYDQAVTHTNTTNWSATIDGVSATVTYTSGSGTTALVYTTSVAAVNGDVVTVTATAPTGHAATVTGVVLAAFANQSVTNNTNPESSVLWRDDFSTLSGWVQDQGPGTLTASGGFATKTASEGGYNVWRNPTTATLPADYEVELALEHSEIEFDYWGVILAYVPNANPALATGIRLFRQQDNSNWYVGSAATWNGDNVQMDVTIPASWTTNQQHTVCVRRSGTTVTLYLDGTLAGTTTGITINQGVSGTHVGFCGDPGNGGSPHHHDYIEVRSVA